MPIAALLIAGAQFLLHFSVAGRYGYFRDELYYIACSRHLAWGYVDQPPLIAVLTWLELHLGGTSLHSLRFLPAVAGAVLTLLAAWMAREMGGGRFAQWFAALCTAVIGVGFPLHYLLTMNAFEPLFWMGCACVVLRIINTGNQKLWLWFGVLAGVGLQNKYSMAFFGAGILVGLLLTSERKALAQPWIWMAGAIAAAIALPNIIWNFQHGWPFFELMANIRKSGRDVEMGGLEFIAQQILVIGPLLTPIWIAGLCSLIFGKGRKYRVLAWAYLFVLLFLIAGHGKNYYLIPAYAMLMAAGAVAMERWVESHHWGWLKRVAANTVVAGAAFSLPLLLPVLKVETLLWYETKVPTPRPVAEKSHRGAAMPQHFSDQFGWEEMAATVAKVYQALPSSERGAACIGAANYGEAGAIDFFGPRYNLPSAISGHQNYFLWGPHDCTGKILILLGENEKEWHDRCDRVDVAAELYHPYGMKTVLCSCAGD
jgi:4-amino-4-deoxy-L-arabinose transferase-like glycosyltransferase